MDVLKRSWTYRIITGCFSWFAGSRILESLGAAFSGSTIFQAVTGENNRGRFRALSSKTLGGAYPDGSAEEDDSDDNIVLAVLKQFDRLDREEEELANCERIQVFKMPSWLENSFFFQIIWTWKDCEGDDRYS